MKLKSMLQSLRILIAAFCAMLLVPGTPDLYARPLAQDTSSPGQEAPKIPNDQLDSLVAPIALFPDPLLAQVLAASTYPLEIIQLQQWLKQHPDLKDKALVDAVEKQDWDPSVQGLAALPDVVKRLAEDIKWTTDLGNAFLAQQADVMDAVQRMRAKAQGQGNLKSSEQVKVETQVVESKQVIVIQQANPQVIYVPSYNPVVVYGPPVYPYPPIYYPPPSYYAAGVAVAFGVGVAMGAYWGGGWGYGCGWGKSTVNINVNNNYVSHYNKTNINNANINRGGNASTLPANRAGGGNNNWQHNPQHRGAAPYSNKATANQYGGTARGDTAATRQANARQNQGQTGARQQPASAGNRAGEGAAASNRPAGGGAGATGANRPSTGAGNTGANRPSTGASNTSANRGGGANSIGNRQVPNTPSAKNTSAFAGAASGTNGGAAKASSQRGASSTGASRGGGGGRKKP
ncbi:MAG TPA: DUF3300 domain-containing protein [Candidatus Acidoferrales bacterium]|nr:DUF3300 domain-containing protein [Candidatus Acidoferrales bacterium]